MKQFLTVLVALLLVVGWFSPPAAQAQTRNITFICNTATVPDTLPVTGATIQMRGGLVNSGTSPITWGNDSVNNMVNIGGDYWSKTVQLNQNDTLRFKFVVAYQSGTGWEQNTTPPYTGMPADNRYFIADVFSDTTLPVQFWNNGANGRPQYFRPWNDNPDPADTNLYVWVRVNMLGPITSGSFGYNNNTDTVAIRGGGPAGSDLDWGTSHFLVRESNATNGDGYTAAANSFWSHRLRIPKSSVSAGQSVQFKYMLGSDWNGRDELQGQPNRSFTIPVGLNDTTLHWVFYNNERPSQRINDDTVIVTFRANMSKAIASGGFSIGDTLYVRSGYYGTALESGRRKEMQNLIGAIYEAEDTIITSVGQILDYQYYAVKNAAEIRESYYNFYFTGDIVSEAERRQVVVAGNSFTVLDTATSVTQARRQPVFPNARTLARNVNVRYEVDMRPAIYEVLSGTTLDDIQGAFDVSPANVDSILNWGVWMNGPAVGGWNNPGGTDWGFDLQNNLEKKLYDDGTNGDQAAGDSIFTRIVATGPDSLGIGTKGQVGQVFKFGIRGGDNEGGTGGFGNNHLENIVDADSTYTIHSQFGSINPAFYDAWDYDNHQPSTGVIELGGIPQTYSLRQNYPNPFNPMTKIEYAIPYASEVRLVVFNLLGQEVATLVNDHQSAGNYRVQFDATALSSGVYFFKLSAGDYVSTRKMVLMK